ncbi:permease [Paenibacillus athensensis]|uniref:Permease n=1 Tax=Paenibacillus athensensis TaxID=1967502 RepID=A0A4Y8PXB7_9BACL|nr:permease [Paenibacillus athensensis]MCD1260602.1 permease [Paenibacillus athensensis]
MPQYRNLDIALYFTTRCIASIASMEALAASMDFFARHMHIAKVYLETHRDDMDVAPERMEELKHFFASRGIATAGAITTTVMQTVRNKPLIDETGVFGCGGTILNEQAKPQAAYGTKVTWSTLCYTNPAHRGLLQQVAEYSASLFDEVIIDDFYFTSCTCPACIEAKGERSWEQFRLELMAEVSENVVIAPAKAVNPDVKLVIKYPNWYEAYQETGYNPQVQSPLFDGIYTGTETRDTNRSAQHLPRYGSYSLMRWMEHVKPGENGGGWIDPWQGIHNLSHYLEQAQLTFFGKGRELTLFCYSWLLEQIFIPALGFELGRLDPLLSELGEPTGIPVYEPFNAQGEDHLYDYLGMIGLALDPTPHFPETDKLILLTQNSAQDEQLVAKLKAHLLDGGDACITTGLLKALQGKGIEEFTTARYTDKKVLTRDYAIGGYGSPSIYNGYFSGKDDVLLPVIDYKNNAGEPLVLARKTDNNFPLLLRNLYGRGTLYVLTVPDDFADVYSYPAEVLSTIRQYLLSGCGIYMDGPAKISMFLYDNDTFIVSSFLDFPSNVRLRADGADRTLTDVRTGETIPALLRKPGETVFELEVQPVLYRVLRLGRE